MRQLPDAALLDHADEAPIVLVGEPGRLKGCIHLHNRAPGRVVLREARLCGLPTATKAARGAAVPELSVSLPAILNPDQKHQVRVRVALDAHTPPGSYRADLRLGSYTCPVEMHVTEKMALEVAPDSILVENRPGGRQAKQMVLTNAGNVPLQVGNIGAVVLDEELIQCKTIRAMLVDGDAHAQTVDQWVSAYLRQGKRQLDSIGMLWVDVEGAPWTLQPGQTQVINLSIRVPDSLDPRSRYHGVAFLYENHVSFTVAPTGTLKPLVRAAAASPLKRAPRRKK